MKIVTVSSAKLRTGPWSAERFMPGEVSEKARLLVRAWDLVQRLKAEHEADGSELEWAALLDPMVAVAEKRARKGSSRYWVNYAERAAVQADIVLFRERGLLPQPE